MLKKVSEYAEKYHMLSAGDTVVAGISGGADSVCLLLLLSAMQEKTDFRLLAVHINHQIRQEAGKDAAFAEELCKKLGISFFLVEENVEALAKAEGISTEEAGRQVRYQAFENVLRENAPEAVKNGQAKIAVAHNLNDRAETMLFHLFRGSGLKGLTGILPVKERAGGIQVIRPLLGVKRSEIEAYLTEKGINWCIDTTNEEDTYTRNRIRHHILPFAEEEVSGGAVANMGRAADILAETEDFVQKETHKTYTDCATEIMEDGLGRNASGRESQMQNFCQVVFSVEKVLTCHPLLRKQMLLYCMEKLTPARKDITAVHIADMLSLFEKEGNRMIYLPYGLAARREYDKVIVEKRQGGAVNKAVMGQENKEVQACTPTGAGNFLTLPLTVTLPAPGEAPVTVWISETDYMEFLVFPYEKIMNIPQNQYTKWFDYGKMSKSISVRTRQTGDYFTFNEALAKKSVQDYMVEQKIPRQKRDMIPLLAEENQILWIVGYRIGSYYKVGEDTQYILQVRFRGEQ
ncbi:MAG: tRNA lysidine(34) synthetase TilS [Lachnospiraceae bacterium]|nr:tRNA lysidine(34) synthetase TilS [Lachnospiraceae bacterium]